MQRIPHSELLVVRFWDSFARDPDYTCAELLGRLLNSSTVNAHMPLSKRRYSWAVLVLLGALGISSCILIWRGDHLTPMEAKERISKYSTALCIDDPCDALLQQVKDIGPLAVPLIIEYLRAELLVDDPVHIRQAGRLIVALGEIGGPDAQSAIRPLLSHPNSEIRINAAMAIANIHAPETAALLLPLLYDNETIVRKRTADIIRDLDDPHVLPQVRSALRLEASNYVRTAMQEAIKSLEKG